MSYKEDMNELVQILKPMEKLLSLHGEESYAKIIHRYQGDCKYVGNENEANTLRRSMLRLLSGGSGSFSDLALHNAQGEWLVEEDTKLDTLKSRLFNTLVEQL